MLIKAHSQFKRDCKKQAINLVLSKNWAEVIYHLTNNLPLPKKYKDHALTGNWKGFRDCHIKPDLVLIYQIDIENTTLILARLGSHSDLF